MHAFQYIYFRPPLLKDKRGPLLIQLAKKALLPFSSIMEMRQLQDSPKKSSPICKSIQNNLIDDSLLLILTSARIFFLYNAVKRRIRNSCFDV